MLKAFAIATILVIAVSINPPVWPDSFEVAFDETFVLDTGSQHVNGIYYYDAAHNRSRADRFNGKYSKFCAALAENVTTPCTNLVVNGSRWVIFPQKSMCCKCCDAAHGCGILQKNWLNGSSDLGNNDI